MTDKIPIFINGGFSYLVQNVTGVTKSSQLSNNFIIVGGFEPGRSGILTSVSNILSLNDYNNM
jgi:hypothetical protein